MKETKIRKLVREELKRLDEQDGQKFNYNRGCIVMQLTGNRVRFEWDLVGSLDSVIDLRDEWPSLYRSQGGDTFARELGRMADGSYLDCSIRGETNLSVYEVNTVTFSKDRNEIFRVEGRDANRFYENVLGAPFDLTDRFVLDQIEQKI